MNGGVATAFPRSILPVACLCSYLTAENQKPFPQSPTGSHRLLHACVPSTALHHSPRLCRYAILKEADMPASFDRAANRHTTPSDPVNSAVVRCDRCLTPQSDTQSSQGCLKRRSWSSRNASAMLLPAQALPCLQSQPEAERLSHWSFFHDRFPGCGFWSCLCQNDVTSISWRLVLSGNSHH